MISVQNLTKAYGQRVVLDAVSFRMTPGERLGFVGRNGAGKTTLFRLLLGEEQPDDGEIVLPRGYRVGHLSQHLSFHAPSILEEVGGYQIRVNLARVLVDQPDLLLLDEPTNYLDIVSVRWLTRFLRKWPGEVIVITHDRGFLRGVTTHSMIVHRQKLRRMEGSVEKLLEQIRTEEQVHESARVNEEKKRRQEERFIERFRSKASKASVVQSRIKALEKRERLEVLEEEQELDFRFRAAPFHATTMLTAEGLEFGFPGGPRLVDDLSFAVDAGDRLAIIGPNGRGKTTLLELLAGEREPDAGSLRANPNTRTAYFGQTNIARLDPERSIEEELLAAQPEASRAAVRGLAGLLMFPGDDAAKPIGVLSGGERSRVLLGKLLSQPANLLLLDEPTNHLDLESVDALLDAVDAFPGAVVLVTHDEAILQRFATRLIVFDGGRTRLFESGYEDFLERVGWQDERDEPARRATARDPRALRRQRAEHVTARGKATRPLERELERTEQRIMRLETEVEAHDAELAQAAQAGRTAELARLGALAKDKRAAIERDFAELERLSEELDRLRAEWDARLAALDPAADGGA